MIDHKDNDETSTKAPPQRKSIPCPVCGGKLSDQLPEMKGILDDLFWTAEYIDIVAADIVLECNFSHARDEEDENFPLEVPHPLVAVIKVAIDKGECTAFDIQDVRFRSG